MVCDSFLYTVRTDNTPKVRFSAMVGEEPEMAIGPPTNLVAVPLSGPILTLGLLAEPSSATS